MPQRSHRSLKNIFIDTVVIIGLFALVGHLSAHFWDRHMIQSELSLIKCSLYSMKETITFIGIAYDNLYDEIKVLLKLAEMKQAPAVLVKQLDTFKPNNNLDGRRVQDLHVQALVKEMHDMKVGKNYNNTCDMKKNNKMTWLDKNATTITRYPLKSIGTDSETHNIDDDECKYENHSKIHRCYNGYTNYCTYP